LNRLDGKVALVSGAARGIGAETAKLMASVGAKVMVGDVLADRARQTVAEITEAGGKALFVPLDVTKEAPWTAAVAATVQQFGGLDILVNNAGTFLGRDFETASLEDWHKLVAINMTGVFLGTRLCAPALREAAKKSKHGSAIVNLASVAGLVGSQLDPLYSMTKGGVTLFTKSTALAFARKGDRIRVNSIHPGVIDTDMGAQTFVSRAEQLGSNDVASAREVAVKLHPIGRLGIPDDIARGIVFLASDDAAFITGTGLVVDGGWTAS
jgi:NAD(P)-dependent dehydrogenase (short-subunit alcohol dehydrogenase family)